MESTVAVRQPRRRLEVPGRARGRPLADRGGRVFLEGFLIWAVFAAVYFLIGHRVVVDQHLVNFDALSRMAHAYFVWHNDPAKLAAVGFVWPPVQTLAFLPFVLLKSMGVSLAALPATSAAFQAGTIVVLNRTLGFLKMRWWLRYPLLLAFGLNPMIVYYGANGMAESVYLFFLVSGLYFFLRWYATRESHLLALVGISLALASLARYEVVIFALAISLAIIAIILRRRTAVSEVEGTVLLYIAPVAYALGAWLFFNWLIVGDPLFFLRFGSPTRTDLSTSQQLTAQLAPGSHNLSATFRYLVALNWNLFPLTVIVIPVLAVVAVIKRDVMAAILAGLASTNAIVTAYLFLPTGDQNLLQLRYNMRAMPIALIGAGWVFSRFVRRPVRLAIWVSTLVVLIVSLAFTWKTMETYKYQYEENVFVRALQTGKSQEGNQGLGGYPIGIRAEREMANYITAHVKRKNAVLTDDAQTLGVMVLTGSPDLFFDRIDKGQNKWDQRLNDPYGHVDYVLVSTEVRCRKPCEDLVRNRYPRILKNGVPGMQTVFANRLYHLLKVAKRPPPAGKQPPGGGRKPRRENGGRGQVRRTIGQ